MRYRSIGIVIGLLALCGTLQGCLWLVGGVKVVYVKDVEVGSCDANERSRVPLGRGLSPLPLEGYQERARVQDSCF